MAKKDQNKKSKVKATVKKRVAKTSAGKKPLKKKKAKAAKAVQPPKAKKAKSQPKSPPSSAFDVQAAMESWGDPQSWMAQTGDTSQLYKQMEAFNRESQKFMRQYLGQHGLAQGPEKLFSHIAQSQFGGAQDPLDVGGALREVFASYSEHPEGLLKTQLGLWQDFSQLWAEASKAALGASTSPVIEPEAGDRRFNHEAWQRNPTLNFIKQSYLITCKWMKHSVLAAAEVEPHTKARALFHIEQLLSALSPTNFPGTNPEVMEETLRTQGQNLQRGMQQMIEDFERGHGELAMSQADMTAYEVGRNIATTKGKVVFQNDILQLIQYNPTTENVAERPLLIFPPWINKFYILDLQPENSLIRWCVDQGRTVFVCSWVNPGPDMADYDFVDYMRLGIFDALEAVEKATGERQVDTIGYCIGGTLLACALAYMAETKDDRIATATFFTAQTDFSQAGELLLFIDDKQIENIEMQIEAAGGILPSSAMARTFNLLRPNDLIWSVYVDNYLKGKEPKKFDLLYWNDDATNQPKALHLFYLKNFYRDNKLSKGELVLDGVRLDLGKVKIPVFMQAGLKDHIAPYPSVYNSAKLFGGDVHYLLAGSGHIAGVINPPSKNKYDYRTNEALPEKIDDWLAGAMKTPGSWWPHWMRWLNEKSSGQVPARMPGDGELPIIEEAPGSYVRVRGA